MKEEKPKRIAIIGLPGSGKSTLACKLGQCLDIPVHHLDTHLFVEKVKQDLNVFTVVQQTLVDQDSWIIEGCSITTLEMRYARADLVLYLCFSRLFCTWRVLKRVITNDHIIHHSGCLRTLNRNLLKYIWNFKKEKNMKIEKLRSLYPHVRFEVFKNPREVRKFLNSLNHSESKGRKS